ncbi:MAG: phosphoribosylamine--glycine ligase [Fimbriimonas sp.]
MRILVVGSGGREHALAWKLSEEAEVIAAPGNAGIAEDVETVAVAATDFEGLTRLALDRAVDLVVVGPEDPLIAGLGDHLRHAGLKVFGPGKLGAKLEGSKSFSKELMFEAGVPTSEFLSFHNPNEAKTYARERFADGRPVVVKASGQALGKGVIVCDTIDEAEAAIDLMMVEHAFGAAGDQIVIEERLKGFEFSLLTIVGDHNFVSLPIAQDYKRIFEGDHGPNTGGMGTYSPVAHVSEAMVREAEERVVAPMLRRMNEMGYVYRGVLFSGLMVDGEDLNCLEYNVRFGDPEIETVVHRLGKGLAQALYQAAAGEVIVAPEILDNAAVTIFVASGGYPGDYRKGLPIDLSGVRDDVKLFHAGTKRDEGGQLVTNGGRVIAASAAGETLAIARAKANAGAEAVQFEGAFYRRDIAQ